MKKVCLLLANGFEAVEASVFTDVIGWNRYEGDGTTDLVTGAWCLTPTYPLIV